MSTKCSRLPTNNFSIQASNYDTVLMYYTLMGRNKEKEIHIMTTYDIRRLAMIFAVQAEIEAMKVANMTRQTPDEAAVYDETHFFGKAQELEDLANKHDHQL